MQGCQALVCELLTQTAERIHPGRDETTRIPACLGIDCGSLRAVLLPLAGVSACECRPPRSAASYLLRLIVAEQLGLGPTLAPSRAVARTIRLTAGDSAAMGSTKGPWTVRWAVYRHKQTSSLVVRHAVAAADVTYGLTANWGRADKQEPDDVQKQRYCKKRMCLEKTEQTKRSGTCVHGITQLLTRVAC
jgi:hypothetical protein